MYFSRHILFRLLPVLQTVFLAVQKTSRMSIRSGYFHVKKYFQITFKAIATSWAFLAEFAKHVPCPTGKKETVIVF